MSPVAPRLRDDLRAAVVPWALAHVIVCGALAAARFLFDELPRHGPRPLQLNQGLFAWDAAFYRDIAEGGYHAVPRAGLRFFPLVPLVSRAIGFVFLDHPGAALLVVASASGLLFGALLHRLVVLEFEDRALARRAVWFGMLAPAAAVLVIGYAEATFMALAVAMFCALRTRRWLWAALFGVLAGLTRPTGLLLAVPAVIEVARWFRASDARVRLQQMTAVIAPAVGAAIYLSWVGFVYHDAVLPLRLQQDPKLRGAWTNPASSLVDAFDDLVGGQRFGSGLHFVWAVLVLALLVVVIRRLPSSYSAFAGITVLVALSAHNLDSFERYAFAAFPLLIGVALLTPRLEVERFVLSLSAAGLLGYSILGFLGVSIP